MWSPTYHSSSVALSQDQVRNVILSFRKHAQFLLLRLSPRQLLVQISLTESYTIMSQTNCFQCHSGTEVRCFWVPLLALLSTRC